MDIAFKCPLCRQQLEVDLDAAGQQIACPACSQNITIPAPDASNMKIGISAHASAASKEDKHFSVPVSETPVQTLIKKALPPLDVAARDGARTIRIKTIRHSDCKEVGHDYFDQSLTDFLNKVGEENIIKLDTVNYSYVELGSQKILADYGLMIIYRG